MATALTALMSMPHVPLVTHPTPVEELTRLRAALGAGAPRLLIKRDDLLSFGCGGNKVRKMQAVAAEARAAGAEALITCGGLQSNHARVTAAAGAALGMNVILVLNGEQPAVATGNTRLDRLFGAEIRFVRDRRDREPAMEQAAADLRSLGRVPFVIPLGASTATGAMGFARGLAEVAAAGAKPDVIVHATSSGGTQAGLIAGCGLLGIRTRVLGISADESAESLRATVDALIEGIASRLAARRETVDGGIAIEVDDTKVGEGYGIETDASREALEMVARREGILLDPVYTAKAMAGLIALVRAGSFTEDQTVLFWHTGGQVGYFA